MTISIWFQYFEDYKISSNLTNYGHSFLKEFLLTRGLNIGEKA